MDNIDLANSVIVDCRVPDRRSSPRVSVMKRALLCPIETEIACSVQMMSAATLDGIVTVPLRLQQRVHVSFDNRYFGEASIQRLRGSSVRLSLRRDAHWQLVPEIDALGDVSPGPLTGAERACMSKTARLVICRPHWVGTVREITPGGLRIQTPAPLPEGEAMLIQMNGHPAVRGRVIWSDAGNVGVSLAPDIDIATFIAPRDVDEARNSDQF